MTKAQFDITSLRKAFLGVSGVYVIGLPLTFLSQILLARFLSVEAFGAFGFAISLVTVVGIPVVAGLPMLLTREVSGYVQAGAIGSYRGIVQTAHLWVLLFSTAALAIAGGVYLINPQSFGTGALARASLVGLLLLPILGLNAIRGGIMKGLGHPTLSEAPTQVLQPALLILGYLALHASGVISAETALFWYIGANALVFAVAYLLLLQKESPETRQTPADHTDRARWLRAVLPFAAMSAVWTLTAQIAVILLGLFGQTEAVAAMRVAERGAMLISFPLMFVNASIGPHIVRLHRSGETDQLARAARYSARMAALAAVPIAAVLIVAGRWLIAVTFGETYADIAYMPLVILVIGQTASVMLGPAGIMLVMTGHERLNLIIQIVGLTVFVSSASLLIGKWGALGAAAGAAFGVALSSLMAFLAIQRHYRIRTSVL